MIPSDSGVAFSMPDTVHSGVLLNELQSQNQKLQNDIQRLELKLRLSRNQLLEQQVKRATESNLELAELRHSESRLKAYSLELQNQLLQARLEAQKLQTENESLVDQMSLLKSENEDLKNSNKDLTRRYAEAKSTIQELDSDLMTMASSAPLVSSSYSDLECLPMPPKKRVKESPATDLPFPVPAASTPSAAAAPSVLRTVTRVNNQNNVVVLSERQLKRQDFMDKKRQKEASDAPPSSSSSLARNTKTCCELFRRSVCPYSAQSCPNAHDLAAPLTSLCKFIVWGTCAKGNQCVFSHDTKRVACKFHHSGVGCKFSLTDSCPCHHNPLNHAAGEVELFVRENFQFLLPLYRTRPKESMWWAPLFEKLFCFEIANNSNNNNLSNPVCNKNYISPNFSVNTSANGGGTLCSSQQPKPLNSTSPYCSSMFGLEGEDQRRQDGNRRLLQQQQQQQQQSDKVRDQQKEDEEEVCFGPGGVFYDDKKSENSPSLSSFSSSSNSTLNNHNNNKIDNNNNNNTSIILAMKTRGVVKETLVSHSTHDEEDEDAALGVLQVL